MIQIVNTENQTMRNVWGFITSCLVRRHWRLDYGRLWAPGHLSAAAAQTVRDAAADAAANAADQGEDQGRHHRRDDRPEPPDGLTGALLAHGHYVGTLVICDAGSAVEFGEPLSEGGLSVIEHLSGVTLLVISKQMSWSGWRKGLFIFRLQLHYTSSFLFWLTCVGIYCDSQYSNEGNTTKQLYVNHFSGLLIWNNKTISQSEIEKKTVMKIKTLTLCTVIVISRYE